MSTINGVNENILAYYCKTVLKTLWKVRRSQQCVCLTKFLQVSHFWHAKTCTKYNWKMHVNWHAQLRSWHLLWLVENINHTSIDTLETEMTCITRQLKFYKLQFKYPENITHNSRRTSYTHILKLNLVLAMPFVTGTSYGWDGDQRCGEG